LFEKMLSPMELSHLVQRTVHEMVLCLRDVTLLLPQTGHVHVFFIGHLPFSISA
jgi:hypothetical protein